MYLCELFVPTLRYILFSYVDRIIFYVNLFTFQVFAFYIFIFGKLEEIHNSGEHLRYEILTINFVDISHVLEGGHT